MGQVEIQSNIFQINGPWGNVDFSPSANSTGLSFKI